jgi:hypothetical protein
LLFFVLPTLAHTALTHASVEVAMHEVKHAVLVTVDVAAAAEVKHELVRKRLD